MKNSDARSSKLSWFDSRYMAVIQFDSQTLRGILFERRGVQVIGISRDSVASHQKFAEKYGLPFVLLSDPELEAIKAYGVWQEKKLYGKLSFGVVRTTFIIDEQGNIAHVMPKVKPDTNASEILALL